VQRDRGHSPIERRDCACERKTGTRDRANCDCGSAERGEREGMHTAGVAAALAAAAAAAASGSCSSSSSPSPAGGPALGLSSVNSAASAATLQRCKSCES
jgi:hypothetical protein